MAMNFVILGVKIAFFSLGYQVLTHSFGWDTVEMCVLIVFKEARHYSRYQKISA